MPQLMYRRDCGCDGGGTLTGWDTPCAKCGAPAVRYGWHLRMYEAMAQYQRFYGFKPMGEHRAFVEAVLGPHSARCAACDGGGIVDSSDPAGWRECDACQGFGSVWTSAPDVVEAARAEVATRYPEAVAQNRTPPPTSPMVAFDVGASTIIDLRDASSDSHAASPTLDPVDSESDSRDEGTTTEVDDEVEADEGPIRWPAEAGTRALTTADVTRIEANDVEVNARIALCQDPVLAAELRRVRSGGSDACDAAWDLGLGQDWYGVMALNAWSEDNVEAALADENGTLWARAIVFELGDGLSVAVVTLDDGVSVVEVIGLCKNVQEGEWMLKRYGTLIKYEWPE